MTVLLRSAIFQHSWYSTSHQSPSSCTVTTAATWPHPVFSLSLRDIFSSVLTGILTDSWKSFAKSLFALQRGYCRQRLQRTARAHTKGFAQPQPQWSRNFSGPSFHHYNTMTRTSVLADALNAINNAEKTGKRQVLIRPSSKVIIKFLSVMQKHGYIGEFEYIDDHRSGKIVVQLTGRLNKCGVISPRFNVKIGDIERWTDNLLPARQFGLVILTTSAGIMDHEEARRKHVSGKILGFVY